MKAVPVLVGNDLSHWVDGHSVYRFTYGRRKISVYHGKGWPQPGAFWCKPFNRSNLTDVHLGWPSYNQNRPVKDKRILAHINAQIRLLQ